MAFLAFYDFICGKVDKVCIDIETLPIDENCSGDYFNDPEFKQNFQKWLNQLWHDKDQRLSQLKQAQNDL